MPDQEVRGLLAVAVDRRSNTPVEDAGEFSQPRPMKFQLAGPLALPCGCRISEPTPAKASGAEAGDRGGDRVVTRTAERTDPEDAARMPSHEHWHSTSAIDTSALPTSSMVLSAASRRLMRYADALDVFHHHDRFIDHDADRAHEAEQVQLLT